jgi:hypothetical protein
MCLRNIVFLIVISIASGKPKFAALITIMQQPSELLLNFFSALSLLAGNSIGFEPAPLPEG